MRYEIITEISLYFPPIHIATLIVTICFITMNVQHFKQKTQLSDETAKPYKVRKTLIKSLENLK